MTNKIKIKAAMLVKINHNLVLKNIFHKNILKKDQVLIKLFYTGICGSQIGEISGIKGKDHFLPHLLGHEATGEVLEVAKNIKKFKKKDKVILHWQKNNNKNSPLPNYSDENGDIINAGWVTTFNNYAVVSQNRLTNLPKNISLLEGVLFGCSLTTAYGSIFNTSKIDLNKNNKIIIVGFGMIGQALLSLLFKKNNKIIIIEKNKKKIEFLKKNFPKIEFLKNINNLKKNLYDVIYETTGNNQVIENSYESINTSGKLILIGVPKYNSKIKINTLGINYGKKIIGSYGGNIKPSKDIPKLINYIINNKINIKNLISGPYKFKDINKIIKKIREGKLITKPILKLDHY